MIDDEKVAPLSFLSPAASAELDERIRKVATEIAARPTHVSQRTVGTVCSLPSRDFLAAARAAAFPSSKVGRLVLARTEDVVTWVDSLRRRAPSTEQDEEDACLAAAGARRVNR